MGGEDRQHRQSSMQKCIGGTYFETGAVIHQTPDGGYISPELPLLWTAITRAATAARIICW
jgi:hypothetical protein